MAKKRKGRFNIFGKKKSKTTLPEESRLWSEDDEGGSGGDSGSGSGSHGKMHFIEEDDDEGGSGGLGKNHLGEFNREKLLSLIDQGKFNADLFGNFLNKDFLNKDELAKSELQKQAEAEAGLESGDKIDEKSDKTAAIEDAKKEGKKAWDKSPAVDSDGKSRSFSSFLDGAKDAAATSKAGSFAAAAEISRRLSTGEAVQGHTDHVGTIKQAWHAGAAGAEMNAILDGSIAGTHLGTQVNHQGFYTQQVRGGSIGSMLTNNAKTAQGQTTEQSAAPPIKHSFGMNKAR